MIAKKNALVTSKLKIQLRPGFHVNSNQPKDEFLIPLKLTWANGPLQAKRISYPRAEEIKAAFSEQPISVFSGQFEIETEFQVASNLTNGPALQIGKLRYQACNDKLCLAPVTVDVKLPLDIQ